MWATTDDAKLHWKDAALVPDAVLTDLLTAAEERCRAYAPAPALDDDDEEIVPFRYKLATVYDARDLWREQNRSTAGETGPDGQTLQLETSGMVRSLLRPPRAVGGIG